MLRKLLTETLDLIFPPRDSEKVIRDAQSSITLNPGEHEAIIYLSDYRSPLVQAAIIENKFHNNRRASKLLGDLLYEWSMLQNESTLYVPIPLGPKRYKERGYNQVTGVLKQVPGKIELEENIIVRPTDTKPQAEISRSERLKNMNSAFVYNDPKLDLTEFSQIVLVDDVTTTGSTLKEAKKCLQKHLPSNIKLTCLALAH